MIEVNTVWRPGVLQVYCISIDNEANIYLKFKDTWGKETLKDLGKRKVLAGNKFVLRRLMCKGREGDLTIRVLQLDNALILDAVFSSNEYIEEWKPNKQLIDQSRYFGPFMFNPMTGIYDS